MVTKPFHSNSEVYHENLDTLQPPRIEAPPERAAVQESLFLMANMLLFVALVSSSDSSLHGSTTLKEFVSQKILKQKNKISFGDKYGSKSESGV